MFLYSEVYIFKENDYIVSLNEVNCSSFIPKSRNTKWDRIASETDSVLMCPIYLHGLKQSCSYLLGVIQSTHVHTLLV